MQIRRGQRIFDILTDLVFNRFIHVVIRQCHMRNGQYA